ncbi:MAG: hypothetical protein ACREHC_03925, partial [Candidatus Levyibacteriota bacterium]
LTTLTPADMNDDAYSTARALGYMASFDAKAGNALGVRVWAQRLGTLEDKDKEELTRVYHLGTTLGDESAFDELRGLLGEGQEAERAKRDQARAEGRHYFYSTMNKIGNVVMECADRGLPADTWMNDFTIDSKHKDILKLGYYFRTKRKDGEDGKALGIQYRDEVTEHFLTGEDVDSEFAIDTANTLWHANEDHEIKRRIFQRIQEKSDSVPITTHSFQSFLMFAGTTLKDSDVLGQQGAQWFEQTAENYQQLLIDNGIDPYKVNQHYGAFQLNLARFYGATPAELIEKIDIITAGQLTMDIPDERSPDGSNTLRNKQFVTQQRENYLSNLAEGYAESGDFETAKTFLSQIASETGKEFGIKTCLTKAKTPEQIAIIKPDDMTMMFDETLGEIIKAREAVVSHNPDEIGNVAKDFARNPKNDSHPIFEGLIGDCVTAAYEHSRATGEKLVEELTKIFKERRAREWKVQHLAYRQLELKDPAGLQILYEHAQSAEKPIDRFRENASVAFQAESFIAA